MKHSVKKRPVVWIAALSVIMIITPACPCKEALALCDLGIQAFSAPTTINIGEAFDVATDVINYEDGSECTTTDIANTTKNLLEVFLEDGSGAYQLVGALPDIAQGSINAGQLLNLLQNVTLHQAGDYRFDYYDDDAGIVIERDENNNYGYAYGKPADKHTQMQQTNNYKSLYIKALPLPDGTTRIENRPIVEFH